MFVPLSSKQTKYCTTSRSVSQSDKTHWGIGIPSIAQ